MVGCKNNRSLQSPSVALHFLCAIMQSAEEDDTNQIIGLLRWITVVLGEVSDA